MSFFIQRSVVIEALQYTGENTMDVFFWIGARDPQKRHRPRIGPEGLIIPTLEGQRIASPGDWIILGVAGDFYPCKPEIFEKTYEAVGR